MKKIISLFVRDYEGTRFVRDKIVPGAEWVVSGEGVATEKIDGTSCLLRDGRLFKRYDAKDGKTPPSGFEPCEDAPDPETGHWPGWLLVSETDPNDKWHMEAFLNTPQEFIDQEGTFELVGPKVQGNKYYLVRHILRWHGDVVLKGVPRTFNGIKEWFTDHPGIEGIVWHHPDGRMVKIKRKDFGLPWPVKTDA